MNMLLVELAPPPTKFQACRYYEFPNQFEPTKNPSFLINTSTLRLLGRFTTCIAQTTTASRLFFALNGTSCLRNEFFLEIFDFKTFFKFCTITMTC